MSCSFLDRYGADCARITNNLKLSIWTYNALPVDVASGSCPEVRLWDVTTPSGVFQSKVVVHRLAEFLLAAEIAFSGLNRGVPKQKLNLFKFSARQMA